MGSTFTWWFLLSSLKEWIQDRASVAVIARSAVFGVLTLLLWMLVAGIGANLIVGAPGAIFGALIGILVGRLVALNVFEDWFGEGIYDELPWVFPAMTGILSSDLKHRIRYLVLVYGLFGGVIGTRFFPPLSALSIPEIISSLMSDIVQPVLSWLSYASLGSLLVVIFLTVIILVGLYVGRIILFGLLLVIITLIALVAEWSLVVMCASVILLSIVLYLPLWIEQPNRRLRLRVISAALAVIPNSLSLMIVRAVFPWDSLSFLSPACVLVWTLVMTAELYICEVRGWHLSQWWHTILSFGLSTFVALIFGAGLDGLFLLGVVGGAVAAGASLRTMQQGE